MSDPLIPRILGSIIAQSAPLMLAVTGETITERSGVINLSLDGSMMLSAMVGFVVAYESSSLLGTPGDTLPVLLGFAAGAIVGAAAALIVAWGSISLKQNQVAIGFVLTLLLADLANFIGQNHTRLPGPSVPPLGIPILKEIPVLGPIFFNHDLLIYFTFLVVAVATWWLYRTQPGLRMRGVGERPEAAFVRGVGVNRVRYLYSAVGGALVGLGGAAFSLDIKLGWSDNHILGMGWIALAIVIFGGWRHPVRYHQVHRHRTPAIVSRRPGCAVQLAAMAADAGSPASRRQPGAAASHRHRSQAAATTPGPGAPCLAT
jgi:ABC-type uncharacterized transport system permease subunit